MTNIIEKPVHISKEEKNGITQSLLREYFDYRDGFLYWKIKRQAIQIGDKAGYIRKNKNNLHRYVIKINDNSFLGARLIFLYHHGYLPETVDHNDRNSLNDRIENLRPATKIENSRNRTSKKAHLHNI